MISLTDIIFSLGALLTVIAYALTDILIIRIFIVVGSVFYIVGSLYTGLNHPGMTSTIVFSLAYLFVNSYQIIRLLLNRIPVFLSEQQKFIYYKMFSSMTPNEFHKLLLLGSEKTIAKNTILTHQDRPTESLFAILSGEVEIKKDEKIIAKLGSGYLIGEMSVLSQHNASATVMTTMQTQVLVWSHDITQHLQKKDRILFEKFKHILTLNLIKKIDSQAEICVELH